jgi:hypothetical protein
LDGATHRDIAFLEACGAEPYPRIIVRDIGRAAKLMVVEGAETSPRIAHWNPHPHTAMTTTHGSMAFAVDVSERRTVFCESLDAR